MGRVVSLPIFVSNAVFDATVQNRALGEAPLATGVPLYDAQATNDPGVVRRYLERIEAFGESVKDVPLVEYGDTVLTFGSNYIEEASSHPWARNGPMGRGIESMFYSMILNTYAAFESFAGDLWTEAVNLDHRLASVLISNRYRKLGETKKEREGDDDEGDDGSETDDTKASERTFSLDHLSRTYQFDLSKRMGTFLVNKKIVGFGSYPKIRRAYLWAFGSDALNIFDANPMLALTAKTRHLIAHRSGLIDAGYRDFLRDTPNFFGDLPDGYLPLTGTQVRQLVEPPIKTAVALIQLVDGLAQKNAERARRYEPDYQI